MALGELGKKLSNLFGKNRSFADIREEIEDTLIEGDIGALSAMEIVDSLQDLAKTEKSRSKEEILKLLKEIIGGYLKPYDIHPKERGMSVILVLGVNGVGKTTTIAKIAKRFIPTVGSDNIILAAGDTFRAAAIEQLEAHGKNLGVRVIRQQPGADPGAVIYDAIESGNKKEKSLILADTAGRMHNKQNLVRELEKIDKIVTRKVDKDNYHKLLILDATTGQNALQQAQTFHEAVGITSIALTKYDSTARGGIGVTISRELGIPFSFIGVGEKMDDLQPFTVDRYVESLIGSM